MIGATDDSAARKSDSLGGNRDDATDATGLLTRGASFSRRDRRVVAVVLLFKLVEIPPRARAPAGLKFPSPRSFHLAPSRHAFPNPFSLAPLLGSVLCRGSSPAALTRGK